MTLQTHNTTGDTAKGAGHDVVRETVGNVVDKEYLTKLHEELHDLCQPLTALQCLLELGRLVGNEAALHEAVDGGLVETQRMFEIIHRIRQSLLREDEETGSPME